jgi:hypothetical protein
VTGLEACPCRTVGCAPGAPLPQASFSLPSQSTFLGPRTRYSARDERLPRSGFTPRHVAPQGRAPRQPAWLQASSGKVAHSPHVTFVHAHICAMSITIPLYCYMYGSVCHVMSARDDRTRTAPLTPRHRRGLVTRREVRFYYDLLGATKPERLRVLKSRGCSHASSVPTPSPSLSSSRRDR